MASYSPLLCFVVNSFALIPLADFTSEPRYYFRAPDICLFFLVHTLDFENIFAKSSGVLLDNYYPTMLIVAILRQKLFDGTSIYSKLSTNIIRPQQLKKLNAGLAECRGVETCNQNIALRTISIV